MKYLINDDDLRRMLVEDLGEDADTSNLLPLLRQLEAPVPDLPADLVGDLLVRLAVEMPRPVDLAWYRRLWESWPLLILRAQFRVVQRSIWLASALVMLLGVLVTLAMTEHRLSGTVLPFVMIAPLVTAVGVCFVYGPLSDPALEIELASRVSPRLMALARLTLVFGFDLALGAIGSIILAFLEPGLTLSALIGAWLAPMAFLSAFAFLLSIYFFDPAVSAGISLAFWMLQALRQAPDLDASPLLIILPDLLAAESRVLVLLASVAMLIVGLWMASQNERWLRSLP